MNKIFTKITNSGFTLIELMVSTSIFMVVMLLAVGSLLTTSDLAKKSYSLNFTMDNLSFAVESMSRSLRMGTNYTCDSSIDISSSPPSQDCENGASVIAFIPAAAPDNYRTAYKLQERTDGTNTIQRCIYPNDGVSCVDLISENINIDVLKFFTRGSGPSDLIQPSVYMILKGSIIVKEKENSFAIQTLVSQRTLE